MTSELRPAVTGKQRERQEVTPKGYVPPCDYYKDGKLPPVLVVWQEARLEYFASDPAIHLHGKGNPTGKDHAASAVIQAYGDEREAKGRAEQAAELAKFKALAETLAGALDDVWKEATAMRNSSKTVGHYHTDHKLNSVYHRTRYHAGKKIMEMLKPSREALRQYKEARDAS